MKQLIFIAILTLCACKTTSEGETTATPTEPETAAQAAADPPAEVPEPTSQPTEEKPSSEDLHPVTECCSGITFDEVTTFPFSFTVSKKDGAIGKITLDGKHVATFEPADGADAEYVAEVQQVVDAANKDGMVSYKYSNRTKETHCKCGGEARQNTPQYAGAFKHSLYSEYFDVSE